MGLFTKAIEKRYSLADMDRDMDKIVFGTATATGVKVSEATALKSVAYFAAIRLISETVAQVPLIYYKRVMRGREPGRGGKERAVDDKLYWLLHEEPNEEMDAVAFKSAMTGQAAVWGNAYAEIEWNMDTGGVEALWPLNTTRMKVKRDLKTKNLVYVYTVPDGTEYALPAYRIWHLKAFGFDGLMGVNNVEQSRESLGLTLALEKHGALFFGNGARPGVVLMHPNTLSQPSKDKNIEHWEAKFGGIENVHRTAILDEGITIKEIGIDPEKSQLLESRTFQIQEIARMTNVTPHKLMELSHATYSNIEHQDLEFLKYTMGIWFRRWEQASNRKLILPKDRRINFYEFLEESLLRADSETRATFYRELSYLGALSPNDIREKENMNPIVDPMGDEYFVQRNMIPLKLAGDPSVIGGGGTREDKGILLEDSARRVAEREKANLTRAAGKYEAEEFKAWLEDFYRDFPRYIESQVRPVLGDEAGAVEEFTRNYVAASRRELGDKTPKKVADILNNWVERKVGEITYYVRY